MKETKIIGENVYPFANTLGFVFNEAKPSTYDISSHASP